MLIRVLLAALFMVMPLLAADVSPEVAFTNSYLQAQKRMDLVALGKLRCLDAVTASGREEDPHDFNLKEKIKSLKITAVKEWPPRAVGHSLDGLFFHDGVKYHFNLPVVAVLHIDYIPGKNSVGSTTDTPLGFKDGRYWMLSIVPAPK